MAKFAKILLVFLLVAITMSVHKVIGAKELLSHTYPVHPPGIGAQITGFPTLERGEAGIESLGCSVTHPNCCAWGNCAYVRWCCHYQNCLSWIVLPVIGPICFEWQAGYDCWCIPPDHIPVSIPNDCQ